MNDFDFEELDKAVNSLAPDARDEHGSAGVVPVASPSTPAAKPTDTPSAAQPPRQNSQPKTPRLSNARPTPRGSFMDIMPPSSRKSNTRVGTTLQPVSRPEDVAPAPQNEPPKEDVQEPEITTADLRNVLPSQAEEHKPKTQQTSEHTSQPTTEPSNDITWPDPLDFHDGDSAPKDEPKKADESRPSASPFLAEAKVEKRPLGAFSAFGQTTEHSKPVEETSIVEPKPDLKAVDELTPKEDGLFKEPEAPEYEQEPQLANEPKETEVYEADKESLRSDMHNKAMMSIPQQYRTEHKALDKETRPVFDTKEYHPPLLEAAVPGHHRGSSVWVKLFVALVVLVLLAVAGYFVYIYMFAQP